jgi:glycosyltransferase involved in cell wall biosynthesis
MKILIAVHHFPPRYAAGAELRAFRTTRWMRQHGQDARAVCIEYIDRGPEEGVDWQDDDYQGVPIRRLSYDLAKAPDRFRWEYDNPWIEMHLSEYLAEFEPDVFHTISGYLMGAGALRAAQKLGIPTVVTVTDFWFLCSRLTMIRTNGQLSPASSFDARACARCKYEEKRRFRLPASIAPPLADLFWDWALKPGPSQWLGFHEMVAGYTRRNRVLMEILARTDRIVCPSQFLVETLRERGVPEGKLILNSHGLDTSSWLPVAEGGSPAETNPGVFRIGYLGQINEHKGVHLIIDALKKLKTGRPIELLIYGNELAFPDYTTRLRKMSHGDARIKIMGRYENQHVARILAGMDVLVIPSLWNEIGPWVMYEAFETKTPVIATNIPNMSYVVQHEQNGLLFKLGDSQDLADQLNRVIDDPDFYNRLINGIPPVKYIHTEMEDLKQVYESITTR